MQCAVDARSIASDAGVLTGLTAAARMLSLLQVFNSHIVNSSAATDEAAAIGGDVGNGGVNSKPSKCLQETQMTA